MELNGKDLRWLRDLPKCCGKLEHLDIEKSPQGSITATCKICNRKHRTMMAEPGRLFGKMCS